MVAIPPDAMGAMSAYLSGLAPRSGDTSLMRATLSSLGRASDLSAATTGLPRRGRAGAWDLAGRAPPGGSVQGRTYRIRLTLTRENAKAVRSLASSTRAPSTRPP